LVERRNQDDGFEAVFQVQRDVFEFPDDREIALGQERVEILENEDGRLHLLNHLIQGCERFLGDGIPVFLRLDGGAGGHDAGAVSPFINFLLPFPGDLNDHVLHAHFFARNDIEDRVARSDQGFEFSCKVHVRVGQMSFRLPPSSRSPPQPAFPPRRFGGRQIGGGFLEPLGNRGRHGGLLGVVAQQFLGMGKFRGGLGLRLVFGPGLSGLLLFLGKFGLMFHGTASGILVEKHGKSFAGAM